MNVIAVLLPVYKNDNPIFFIDSLNSILNQTYKEFKVLIGVDGPVDDELLEILKSIENDSKIQVIYFYKNRGLACVLNDLLDVATKQGIEYFARMDADDVCTPDRFQKQLNFLYSHPEVDVVGGAIEEINEKGKTNGKKVIYPLTHKDCRCFFRYRDPLAHPASFFRKRFFIKAKGYRPEYRKNQDTMLWFDGFINGCVFANLPDTVLYFRVAKDFYSRRNGWRRAKQMFKDRIRINKALHYDFSANLFALAMFCMTVSPTFIKKFLYKIR